MRRSILTAAAAAVVIACSAASPAFADEIDGVTDTVIVEETENVEEPGAGEEPAVDPIPVTPIGVEYFDDCGTMNDGFFLPEEEEGVIDYLFESDGWGTPITVTAVLEDGYVLADGAVGVWEYPASTDEPCEDGGTGQPAPPQGEVPVKLEPAATSDEKAPELAATGADGGTAIVIGGGALLLGGALLGAQALRRRAAAKQ
jgi:hypothetical protein